MTNFQRWQTNFKDGGYLIQYGDDSFSFSERRRFQCLSSAPSFPSSFFFFFFFFFLSTLLSSSGPLPRKTISLFLFFQSLCCLKNLFWREAGIFFVSFFSFLFLFLFILFLLFMFFSGFCFFAEGITGGDRNGSLHSGRLGRRSQTRGCKTTQMHRDLCQCGR